MVKPTGGFAEAMLDGGGWPDVAEDAFYDRARQYLQVLRQVTEVLDTFRQQQGEIFVSGVWSGSAAGTANGQIESNIDELVKLQNDLATAITWQRKVAGSIEQAKSDIGDNVEAAHRQINLIEQDSKLEPAERTAAINSVVAATRTANVSVVQGTAEQILQSKDWKPPERALQDLLDQKAPPDSSSADPLLGDRDRRDRSWGQGSPDGTAQSSTGAPPPATTAPPPATVMAPAPPAPVAPPTTGGSAPAVPPSAPKPLSPAESAPPLGGSGRGTGMPAAPAAPAAQWAGPRDTGPAMAPASATGMPSAPAAPAGSRGAAAGSGAGSGAPIGQNSPGSSAGMRPAAATTQHARDAAAARPKAVQRNTESDSAAAVPVSAARAERDAAAAAARRGEADPLVLARRIAAALNAPDSGGAGHLKFFWVTAVTTEGVIVVANNYGLAYLPDSVRLPEQVQMASAEKAIPATERARWATYPVIAVQGWAGHRNTKLRAVIATEEQFGDSDPGVAKIVLKPEDIPESGAMAGRSRLEVVDPSSAQRLAGTPDSRLAALLPAPPASAPIDGRSKLWLEVMRPLASRASGREKAHLRAFRGYAAHAQEVILGEARASADPAAQRCAVADWLYWKHVTGLLDAATAPSPAQPAASP
ncbi:secretion protein EspK [Mycobacterium sp. pR1184]|uniref:secretion protein EspK n=1 Tax=Mycobacterium sp. pR1184 TaxID=3238981 RepID=UPI00351B7881